MRKRLAIDVETFKTQPGIVVPRLVCMSVSDGKTTRLYDREHAVALFRELIDDNDVELVGHHVPFDLAVLAKESGKLSAVFDAIERRRVRCTMVRQQLIDIAEDRFRFHVDATTGKPVKTSYGLAQVTYRHLGMVLAKGADTYRTRYHELADIPIDAWPLNARTYAMDDAEVAWRVAEAQDNYVGHEEFPTEHLQMRSAWACHLMSARGIRTNPVRTAKCREEWLEQRAELDKELKTLGLVRADGSKDTKAIAAYVIEAFAAKGLEPPRTPTRQVSLDKQILKDCNHPVLNHLVARNKVSKYIETYLPLLLAGNHLPFNAAWHVLVQSGRTSCGGGEDSEIGNLQNLPRSGPVRECFEARPGMLFCATDLDTAEMRSLAEVCLVLGISPVILAEELRAGRDPHLAVAAEYMGISYEEAERRKDEPEVEAMRQFAKPWNFGGPGGMGPEGMVEYAKGYGVHMTVPEAKVKAIAWKRHYREMPQYFRFITNKTRNGRATTRHPVTGFVRGGTVYTELANHYFQHLTACCAKDAHYEITKEGYLGRSTDGQYDGVKRVSPLYGSYPVMMVHDETVTETPESVAHEAAHRQAELMKAGADVYIKQVPNSSSIALMKNLHKKAKAVYENERLVAWRPAA